MPRLSACIIVVVLLASTCYATTITLQETGQTSCFNAAGPVMPCVGTGQDGDLLKGAAWPNPRFVAQGNGTVIDNLTGLTWLQNGNCFGVKTWQDAMNAVATLSTGGCGLTDGSSVGQWRLPNRKELMSLINRQTANSATWLVSQSFTNMQSGYYWSSSTCASDSSAAWGVQLGGGDIYYLYKTSNYSVLAVRGGQ